MRRSPGGGVPNSSRRRPLEPPSSATVTMAVMSSVTRRSADSEAARPWPPPSATTRLPDGPRDGIAFGLTHGPNHDERRSPAFRLTEAAARVSARAQHCGDDHQCSPRQPLRSAYLHARNRLARFSLGVHTPRRTPAHPLAQAHDSTRVHQARSTGATLRPSTDSEETEHRPPNQHPQEFHT